MKTIGRFHVVAVLLLLIFSINCCEIFNEKNKKLERYSGEDVTDLLQNAYNALYGTGLHEGEWVGDWAFAASPSNWMFGGVRSDDAYWGCSAVNELALVNFSGINGLFADNELVYFKWAALMASVNRCNKVLNALKNVYEVGTQDTVQIRAEALFLRAWFCFDMKRVFDKIPYVTENDDPDKVKNDQDAWPKIIQDLVFAVNVLPETQTDKFRPTCFAAKAVLARVYLFTKQYDLAKVQLDDIINSGRFNLTPHFEQNFTIEDRNNAESIYEIQYNVMDGATEASHGSYGDGMNFPGSQTLLKTCCGFYQPSQNLVNAFKVDENGLPLFSTYNDEDLANDKGLKSEAYFLQDTIQPIDPRLDHTVLRRGIPAFDWGVMSGNDWIREQNYLGPYAYKKTFTKKSEYLQYASYTGWLSGNTNNNYRAYRYAHVLLWRAEVAIYENTSSSLEYARTLINTIRARAVNSKVMGRVRTFTLPAEGEPVVDYNVPAANYQIGQYPASGWDKDYALQALQWELRLETAMEGQRFFDLVRWGIASTTLNNFYAGDKGMCIELENGHFTDGKNEYMPIPASEVSRLPGILQQNPGY